MTKAEEEREVARLAARAAQIIAELDAVVRQISEMLREGGDDDTRRTG